MRKWRDSFRTVVQETKFDWRFLIESRTHQTPTDTSNTYWQFTANSPRKGSGGREGGKERVYVKIDSELLGERRREITGDLAYSSFSIIYFFFSCNPGSPKGSACENESVFGEVTNLNLAMSTPDYCDDNFFFPNEDSKKLYWRVLLPAYFLNLWKSMLTNNGSCFVRANENNVAWRTLAT
jgi:hypothetical protein